MSRARLSFAFLGLVAIAGAGCVAPIEVESGPVPVQSEVQVRLHQHELTLHLSSGTRPGSPLIIYATGDAGWWGKDKELYNMMAGWGYLLAGFSARDYVGHLAPPTEIERPAQVANDYLAIIAAARQGLGLSPNVKIVLVGKSRGAGLEVAAAATPILRPSLEGVIAIGLTKEEEHVERRAPGAPRASAPVMLLTYQVLGQVGRVPLEVIQSTGDQYIQATDARVLFGPDTAVRRFCAIESSDHNFSGALPAMYGELQRGLEWVLHPDLPRAASSATSCQ